jgi:hypothetical protein
MTLTWSKTLLSHSLTIHAPYIFSNSITISLNPSSTFSLLLSWGLNNNGSIGQGVFIFQVGDYIKGTMWPEMVGVQKRLTKKSMCDSDSNSIVLQWADENNSESCRGSNVANGFSLLPYAWTQN